MASSFTVCCTGEHWALDVRWADGSIERVPLSELACGIQPGWCVQDVPLSTVRHPLETGRAVQRRLLGGREQILVQWDDSGRSTWMPYESLRRIKDPARRFSQRDPGQPDAAERLRLRLLAHALENWNQPSGSLDRLDIDPLPHQTTSWSITTCPGTLPDWCSGSVAYTATVNGRR
ncbi:MAG: hypothetical protein RML45_10275 [Acetobacteraceae bacterium]|nr:hypothetical protein [Acetobacteraceae bacterium]